MARCPNTTSSSFSEVPVSVGDGFCVLVLVPVLVLVCLVVEMWRLVVGIIGLNIYFIIT